MPPKYKDKQGNLIDVIKSTADVLMTKRRNENDPSKMTVQMSEAPKAFSEIEDAMHEHNYGGKRAWLMFPNGYGASIICTSFSYGSPEAPWELAVMTKDGICYDTPLTDDVIGHLTEDDVVRICGEIFNLPPTK